MSDVIKEVTFLDENLTFKPQRLRTFPTATVIPISWIIQAASSSKRSWSYGLQASCEIEAEMADFTKRRKEKQPLSTPVRAAPSNVRPVIIQVPLSGRQVLPALSWAALK